MAFLAPILANGKLIGFALIAAMIVGLGGYAYVEHRRVADREQTIAEQRGQLDTIQAANASLTASMDALKADHARQVAALTNAAQQAAQRASRTAQSIQVIRNAPPTDDAPVAPVLSGALDRLRKPGASGGGAKPSGATVSP